MSEWITDRRPTAKDAHPFMTVWAMLNGKVCGFDYEDVVIGQPWMPIAKPEPYVKPKRYNITADIDCYIIYDGTKSSEWGTAVAHSIPTREAAERIAAIYEESLP